VAPTLSPVKPVYQAVECSSEAKNAATKEDVVAQSASVTAAVHKDHSPQRKKARRVVLQTLSTNVEDCTNVRCEVIAGKTEVTKSVVFEEKCRPAMSHADIDSIQQPCSGQDEDFSKITNCEVATNLKPECMEVGGDMQVTEVSPVLYSLLEEDCASNYNCRF